MASKIFHKVFYVPGSTKFIDWVDPETAKGGYSSQDLSGIQKKYHGAIQIDYRDALESIESALIEKYKEIHLVDEDRYFDMLEALPPHRGGSGADFSYFLAGEAL